MAIIKGQLITVRTSRQGAAMENGKGSQEYLEEISTLTLSADDLALLGIAPGGRAVLKSSEGEVTVTCRTAKGPRGVFFLPLGPVANQLISGETHGTGVPNFKGIQVWLEGKTSSETGSREGEESVRDQNL